MYWENFSEKVWDNIDISNDKEIKYIKNIYNTNTNFPVIYVDMDGTLFQWNRMKSKEYPDGVTSEMVFTKGYFGNLKPNEGILNLVKTLYDKGYNIRIASKAKHFAINEKYESLLEYAPFIKKEDVFFIPLNANKSDFLPNIKSNDILIDDYNPNLEDFNGIPIKCVTEMNSINPKYNWIEENAPVFKNMDKITWALLKEWKLSQTTDNKLKIQNLKYIYDKSLMTYDNFKYMCKNLDINLENLLQEFNKYDYKDYNVNIDKDDILLD